MKEKHTIPEGVEPHLRVLQRGARRYVYVRWVWREKKSGAESGKVRGTGASNVRQRGRYLGTEPEVIKHLLKEMDSREEI